MVRRSGDLESANSSCSMIDLVVSIQDLLNGIDHGVSAKHLQAYLNEFTFRFNRRFTRSTRSARCSASRAALTRRPMPTFIRAWTTLHLAGVCANRIGRL